MTAGRGWARLLAAGFSLAVALGFSSPECALAQSGADGAIGGRVLSSTGVPVPGAWVIARQLETGLAMEARSGTKGEFLLVRLPVGDYVVTVEHFGVELTLPGQIAVSLGEVTEVEAEMRAGVTLGSGSGGVARGRPSTAELSEADLESLPVDAGQWRSLALTAPAANAAAEPDDSAGEVSFRGIPDSQNSSRTDGVSGDESFSGTRIGAGIEEDVDAGSDLVADRSAGPGSGPTSVEDGGRRAGSAYTFAQGAVREFRVQGQGDAASYGSALYGHGVGGVVTTVSRSGSSRLHGMAFYTVRDSAWAAANPFSIASDYVNGVVTSGVVKPRDLRQQFGGSIGGPLDFAELTAAADRGSARTNANGTAASEAIARRRPAFRPRLFYFYAFDQQRRNFPAISSPGYTGFYSLTATQTALLANRGVTPAKTMAALNYLDSLTGTAARQSNQTVSFARLDWQRSHGSRFVFEYNRARWSNPAGARSGPVVDRGAASLGSSFGKADLGVARWVHFFTPGLSNELRLQFGRELQYETAQPPLSQEPNVGPGAMPPEVSIGPDGLLFGTPAALGQRAYPDEHRTEIADVFAWVRGRHFLQFGGDFSAIHDFTNSLTNVEGTFSYDSGVTGGKAGGLVDWITDYTFNVNAYPNGGCPSILAAVHDFCFRAYSQSFGQQSLSFSTQEWAGFLQDDWRLAQRLTLHAGMRYEYEFLPLPQQPNAGLDEVFGATGATSVYPEDRNNLGPRLGLVWEPLGAGRGTIRAGWGAYFGKLPGATIRAALLDTAMPNSVTRIRITPTTETLCPQRTTVAFGYACSYLSAAAGVVAATTAAVVFDRRFRLPAIQQGTLALEHALGRGVLGSMGYTLNFDRQLPNSADINIAPATAVQEFQLQGGTGAVGVQNGETFAVPVYTARVSPSFGPVTDMVSNANATYNGLTLEARRGFGTGRAGSGRGLEFRIAWTWSKAIDFGQNAGAVPRTDGQFDPFNIRYDKGLSALNFPHRVLGAVVWQPRLPEGFLAGSSSAERALRTAAAGWSLAAIFAEANGRGYSYEIFGGTRLPGGHESINGSGGSIVLPTVGRNTLRLPDSANLDLRLSRGFRLREGLRLHAAAEIFNLMNHLNYSGVQQRAFLVGTPAPLSGTSGPEVTPLVFQDAATVASEGLNVQPFGAYTAAGTSQARERQIQLGLRMEF